MRGSELEGGVGVWVCTGFDLITMMGGFRLVVLSFGIGTSVFFCGWLRSTVVLFNLFTISNHEAFSSTFGIPRGMATVNRKNARGPARIVDVSSSSVSRGGERSAESWTMRASG